MSLINALMGTATKLGLVKIVTVKNVEQPTRITTRSVSLKDLTKEIGVAVANAPAAAPAEYGMPFEQVFTAAGIKPIAGDGGKESWTIDALYQLGASDAYKDMPREKAQAAILGVLAGKKVAAEDLVKDAMARDQAIDAHGAQLFQQYKDRRRLRARQKAVVQEQIAALQAQLNAVEAEGQSADRQWNEWWQRKLAYERQMAHAVGYLLRDPIVTIDAQVPMEDNSV